MKKIKLTESTLQRIIERVIKEQKTEDANKELLGLFQQLVKADENEKKEINAKIKDLFLNNPHLKGLQGALTPEGKQALNKS